MGAAEAFSAACTTWTSVVRARPQVRLPPSSLARERSTLRGSRRRAVEHLSTVVTEVYAACSKERIVVVADSVCVDTRCLRRSAMVLSVQESFAYGAFGPLLLASEEEEGRTLNHFLEVAVQALKVHLVPVAYSRPQWSRATAIAGSPEGTAA